MKSGSSQVPKQYYGYSLQCTEFVSTLIDAKPGTVVSLEVFEDVGSVDTSGKTVAIQTKAGTGKNPVSDSAVDLWKTFRNWIDQINSGALNADNCSFEIYVGAKKKGKLCSLMADAKSEQQASEILAKIKQEFLNKKTGKIKNGIADGLKPHIEIILSQTNQNLLRDVIVKFNYRTGTGSTFEDLCQKLEKAFIDKDVIDDVLLHGLGWVKKTLDERIEKNLPPRIKVDDFRSEITTFRNKLKSRPYLPSFARDPSQTDIEANKLSRYVRQLSFIESTEDEIYEAITDFLRAKSDAVQYARRNLVNTDSFKEFTEGLKTAWKNLKKKLELQGDSKNDIHFGQRLVNACLSERRTLEGIQVPDRFTPGCFHALADVPELGWHPDYVQLLENSTK